MADYSCLVVEDSPMMRQLLVFALARIKKLTVTEADDGVDGLRKLAAGKFDLIITDINMPDINGLELVKFVRESERHRETPLVLISTDSRAADRERGMKLGADAYLVKPFEPQQLLDVVSGVVKR